MNIKRKCKIMKNVCRVKVTIFIEVMAVLRLPIYSHIQFDRHLLFWRHSVCEPVSDDSIREFSLCLSSVCPSLSPSPPPPPPSPQALSLLLRRGNEFYRQHRKSCLLVLGGRDRCLIFRVATLPYLLKQFQLLLSLKWQLNLKRKKGTFAHTFAKWANKIFAIMPCAIYAYAYEYSDEHITFRNDCMPYTTWVSGYIGGIFCCKIQTDFLLLFIRISSSFVLYSRCQN